MPTIKTVEELDPLKIKSQEDTVLNTAINISNKITRALEGMLPLAVSVGANEISAFPSVKALVPKKPKKLSRGSLWVEISDKEIRRALELMKRESPLAGKWVILIREDGDDFQIALRERGRDSG